MIYSRWFGLLPFTPRASRMRFFLAVALSMSLLIVGCGGDRSIKYVKDERLMREEVLKQVPIGTPIEQAAATMKVNGFRCAESHDARRKLPCLHCDISVPVSLLVKLTVHVTMVYERDTVANVEVVTYYDAP